MADPFVAEIRIVPFTFAPSGWAFCNGQLLPIVQNTALFSLLGTMYGGTGSSNFALPNLQGRAPMHPGQGSGLSLRDLGESGGSATVTLLESEIPTHNHSIGVSPDMADLHAPSTVRVPARSQPGFAYTEDVAPLTSMAPEALSPAGGSQPHNNMQPCLTVNFCIALQGIYPPRS